MASLPVCAAAAGANQNIPPMIRLKGYAPGVIPSTETMRATRRAEAMSLAWDDMADHALDADPAAYEAARARFRAFAVAC